MHLFNYIVEKDHTTGETHGTVLSKGLPTQASPVTSLMENVPPHALYRAFHISPPKYGSISSKKQVPAPQGENRYWINCPKSCSVWTYPSRLRFNTWTVMSPGRVQQTCVLWDTWTGPSAPVLTSCHRTEDHAAWYLQGEGPPWLP